MLGIDSSAQSESECVHREKEREGEAVLELIASSSRIALRCDSSSSAPVGQCVLNTRSPGLHPQQSLTLPHVLRGNGEIFLIHLQWLK